MDTISSLLEFIEKARGDRKYSESTARGYVAAVKLFAAFISAAERTSFDTFKNNIDNIAADIYSNQTEENITVTTLLVYKRRVRKLINDFHTYGLTPETMATWNPRRYAAPMKPKQKDPAPAEQPGLTPVVLRSARASTTNTAGFTSSDTPSPAIIMNRSEISLRPNLRFALELPVDLTDQEAAKIKQLIDIMQPPQP